MKIIIPRWRAIIIYPLIAIYIYLIKISFSHFFIPEATVSFLIGVCSIRMLHYYPQKLTHSDYLLGFLFFAGLSLFNNSLGFMLYLVLGSLLTFVLLANIDWNEIKAAISIKTLLKYFFLVAPLTFALFFFFPRFRSFFPSANSALKGEVGYSQEVNNSQTANLSLSEKVAFYAEMPKLENNLLYWRGRVLDFTDGYNWKSSINYALASNLEFNGKSFAYQIKYEQQFKGDLILLDVPYQIESSQLSVYSQKGHQSFHTYEKNKKNLVRAISFKNPPRYELTKGQKKLYLQKPSFTPKALKDILSQLKTAGHQSIIESFKNYLQKNNFVYTLSPGNMPTLKDFIENKKGYCTHYAALFALIFRHLNIPSRLVTGFQGGVYNEIGGHYTIQSSDAHAWVEYWQDQKWNRVDPTQFVAPLRISQGFSNMTNTVTSSASSFFFSSWINSIKQNYDNINYRVSLFLDNYDRSYQKYLAERFKVNLKHFYILGLILLIPLYLLIKNNLKPKTPVSKSKIDKLFLMFQKKLLRYKITLNRQQDIESIQHTLQKIPLPHRDKALDILELYQQSKYSKHPRLKILTDKIKKF